MAATKHLLACLLATLMVAGAMPVDGAELPPIDPPVNAPPGPICEDYDNESGFDGTHVYCDFSCGKSSLISIAVQVADNDAQPEGNANCGGAHAHCYDTRATTCAAPAKKVTSDAGVGKCHGESHEFSDSGVWVACASANAAKTLCDLLPNAPGCDPDRVPSLPPACLGVTPPGLPVEGVESVLAQLSGGLGADTFTIAFLSGANEGSFLMYDGDACIGGTF